MKDLYLYQQQLIRTIDDLVRYRGKRWILAILPSDIKKDNLVNAIQALNDPRFISVVSKDFSLEEDVSPYFNNNNNNSNKSLPLATVFLTKFQTKHPKGIFSMVKNIRDDKSDMYRFSSTIS